MATQHHVWGDGWAQPLLASPHLPDNDLSTFEQYFSTLNPASEPWGWQRQAIAAATSVLGNGLPAYDQFLIQANRQEGKTTLSESLLSMWLHSGLAVAYAWPIRKLARKRMLKLMRLLEAVGADISTVETNGLEQITHPVSGGRIDLMTAEDSGARGDSYDKVLVDEYLDIPPAYISAVVKTMATKADAQMIGLSSAPKETSEALWALRDAAQAAHDGLIAAGLDPAAQTEPRTGAFILGLDKLPDDPADETIWHRTMPTLGLPGGVGITAVRTSLENDKPADFAREFLGVGQRPKPDAAEVWATTDQIKAAGDHAVFAAAVAAALAEHSGRSAG